MCAGPPAAGEKIVINFLKVTVKPQKAYFIQCVFGVDLRQHKRELCYTSVGHKAKTTTGHTLLFWTAFLDRLCWLFDKVMELL